MIGTRIEYIYRDAGNYKFWGEIQVSGRLSLEKIRPFLFDQEYFLPDAVGMKSLVPVHMSQDDHELHEFSGFSEVKMENYEASAGALLRRFKRAAKEGWFAWRERNGLKRNLLGY